MDNLINIKELFPKLSAGEIAIGVIFGFVAQIYGGWSEGMTLLVIAMAIDYVSGLIVAAVFHASKKTENGGLESRAGWKGLVRKGMTLAIVLIAARLDIMLGTTFIRDAVVIGFLSNEVISIIENAGLMGLPIPQSVVNMIDLLKTKEDEAAEHIKPVKPEEIEPEEDPGTNNTIDE